MTGRADLDISAAQKSALDEREVILSVEDVSKKFCKKLRRSMAYGLTDLTKNLFGIKPDSAELRKEEFWALKDIDFELRRGDVLGLIGINGSGKTTLLRLLSGIFPPDKGEIMIKGRVGALIALGAGFHPYFSGRENIYLNGAILGISRDELDAHFDKIVEFSEIGDFIDAPVATYSSGMRVRLGFSVAIAMKPDVLLIDEVLAVGDLGFKVKCLNEINELMKNAAVIFVSHSMQFVYRICTKIMVLNEGRIVHYSDDVEGGIDYYHSQFKQVEKRISGSGKATVSDVFLSSDAEHANNNGMLCLAYGDNLVVEMNLSINETVENPVIRVFIYNQAMQPVADCWSEQSGFKVSNLQAKSTIRLIFNNVQLHAGVYSIGIAVLNLPDNEILYRSDYLGFFQVKNIPISWAPVVFSGEWEEVERK